MEKPSTGIRLAELMRTTGSLEPARQGLPHSSGKLAPHAKLLVGWVRRRQTSPCRELAAKLMVARGVTAHPTSLSLFLIARGFSVKKQCWQPRSIAVTWRGTARPGGTTVSPG
jgi:transposase